MKIFTPNVFLVHSQTILEVNKIFVQFHSLSFYRNDLYWNNFVSKRPVSSVTIKSVYQHLSSPYPFSPLKRSQNSSKFHFVKCWKTNATICKYHQTGLIWMVTLKDFITNTNSQIWKSWNRDFLFIYFVLSWQIKVSLQVTLQTKIFIKV